MAKDVRDWLTNIGFGQYADAFEENAIEWELLTELDHGVLKDVGINTAGHRLQILKAIRVLGGKAAPAVASALSGSVSTERTAPSDKAERRQLTVMFCDLVGSTALSTKLDPEDLREVIRAYQETCAAVIARFDGFVAKFMGDGVLAYFGYPRAHEDDAERAVRAGLDLVAAVTDLGTAKTALPEAGLAVRVGIDTGLVVVGDTVGEDAAEEASVVGETPNVAARLQSLAQPDQVVVGPLTRELIGEAFDYEDLGEHDLKGIAVPVRAWRVVRERDSGSDSEIEFVRDGLPLIGRQEELGLLLRSWEASKHGQGQVVLVQGEAGIGKSRLVEALREHASGEDYIWVALRCSPYHTNSTLYPIIEYLKRRLGWTPEDNTEAKLAKLEAVLALQSQTLEVAVPLYAELISLPVSEDRYAPLALSAQEKREQLLDALAGWLLEQAEQTQVLCLWEDLHWADPTTLELLRLCIEQSPMVSMLNVLTYRPEFVPAWTMRSHMTPITLNRLERLEIEAMIACLVGGKALPEEVVGYILDKTDGVPLYVEELTKAILEENFLRELEDCYELTGPLSAVTIPATLQDSLMGRLDRLPGMREVAQIGAILGREFANEMLQAITSLEETVVQKGLGQLVDAELLYQRGRWPRAKYIFKHALVQDAAYQSLLKRTRQYYHRQVAELLESHYPEVVQAQPELVARHYARAEQADKAAQYLIRFAEKAAGVYAHVEAILALEEACAHVEHLPAAERDRQVLDLVVRQAQSLHFLGRRQEIVHLLGRHRERLEQLGETALACPYYFWLGFAHSWLGHRAEAIENLHRSLEEATRAKDEAVLGRVHRALATECIYSGRPFEEAIAHASEAAALLERTEDQFWLSQALFTLSYCYIFAGYFDLAREAAGRLETFGEATGIRRAKCNAAMLAGLAWAMQGNGGAGTKLCEQALEISPDLFETAFVLACLGRACLETGDMARAVAVLEQAVDLADQVRSLQFRAWFRTMLGEAFLLNGDIDKADRVVRKALEASTETRFLLGVALSRQLLGRIARTQGLLPQAQADLEEALQMFTALGARFELGRAHLELAATIYARGNHESVAQHLQEARTLFATVQVPHYIEHTDQLSERLNKSLSGEPV